MIPSPILTGIREVAEFLGKKLDKVVDAIKSIKEPKPVDLRPLASAIDRLATKETAFDVAVDTSALEAEVKSAAQIIKDIKKPDLSSVEQLLATLVTSIEQTKKAVIASSDATVQALKGISLSVPDTFKLDEMQLRSIRSGGMKMNPNPLTPNLVTLTNVSLSSANTQYTHTFGSNCVSWELRTRDTDVPLLVAYQTGKLPTSGDGSAYFTVPAYYIQRVNGVDWGGKTLYMQTASASQIVEVIEYRA